MQSTLSLPSLPCTFFPHVVTPDWVLSMGLMEQFDILAECKQMTYATLNCLK